MQAIEQAPTTFQTQAADQVWRMVLFFGFLLALQLFRTFLYVCRGEIGPVSDRLVRLAGAYLYQGLCWGGAATLKANEWIEENPERVAEVGMLFVLPTKISAWYLPVRWLVEYVRGRN
jgi:hypothetical protein